jgi:hypothetical protein
VSTSVYRRCGCRDDNGKQYGTHCPDLKTDLKHGTWAYLLSAGSDPRTKKRRQYRKAGFATKGAAVSALAKLRTSLDSGTYTEPSKKTLAEYAPEALKRRLATGTGLKPTTAATYGRYVAQDIVPSRLGEMLLTDIRRSHVNTWIADLTKAGRGAVTVRRALATLQMIFSTAVRDEIIPASPPRGSISRPCLITQSKSGSLRCSWSSSTEPAVTDSGHCLNSPRTRACVGVRSPGSTGPMLTWWTARSS